MFSKHMIAKRQLWYFKKIYDKNGNGVVITLIKIFLVAIVTVMMMTVIAIFIIIMKLVEDRVATGASRIER